jgi:glycosyltransferase involved in cell wall biosynthesis
MRILIATDSFPPRCGGSGWSTYELCRGLRARGHDVIIVKPVPSGGHGLRQTEYEGFRIQELGFAAPNIPYLRNYFKSERLARILGDHLSRLLATARVDVVHAQHVMTALPAIDAAHGANVPAIVTVRDYWPVCYWSDLIRDPEGLELCPACSVRNMSVCIRPRAGAVWPMAMPMIPYMRANLRAKRNGVASADAVIAVSGTMAADLKTRAPELRDTRIEIIPNPVDVAALRAMSGAAPLERPYALYLGKLAPNKGTDFLIDVVDRSGLDWPLVVAGDGPDRARLEQQAGGRGIRFLGWLDKVDAVRWLAHASLLIFPSRGPESLSRVLIEASALGVPIAAMETGGTRDIIDPGHTGLLSATPDALAIDVRRLRGDEALRAQLGSAARQRAEREFDAPSVVTRVEHLYMDVSRR